MIDGTYDDAVAASASLAAAHVLVVSDTSWDGYLDVPAHVIEGYTTIFAEVDEQLGGDAIDLVVVPMGVGALTAAVVAHYATSAAIVAVEPLTAACGLASARAGEPAFVPGPHDSIMAGLNCGTVSLIAWPTVQAGVDAFIAVDDPAAEQAMRDLAAVGVVAGETGAASLAGLRALVAHAEEAASTCAAAVPSCCAPRAPPTRSPTSASWGSRRSAGEAGRHDQRGHDRRQRGGCRHLDLDRADVAEAALRPGDAALVGGDVGRARGGRDRVEQRTPGERQLRLRGTAVRRERAELRVAGVHAVGRRIELARCRRR